MAKVWKCRNRVIRVHGAHVWDSMPCPDKQVCQFKDQLLRPFPAWSRISWVLARVWNSQPGTGCGQPLPRRVCACEALCLLSREETCSLWTECPALADPSVTAWWPASVHHCVAWCALLEQRAAVQVCCLFVLFFFFAFSESGFCTFVCIFPHFRVFTDLLDVEGQRDCKDIHEHRCVAHDLLQFNVRVLDPVRGACLSRLSMCFFFRCGIGEIIHAARQCESCRFTSCPSKNSCGPRPASSPKSRTLALLETMTTVFQIDDAAPERQMALGLTGADQFSLLFRSSCLASCTHMFNVSDLWIEVTEQNKRCCVAVVSSFMRMADQQWPSSDLLLSELRKPFCQSHSPGLDGFLCLFRIFALRARAATVVLGQSLELLGRQLDQSSVQQMYRGVVWALYFLSQSVVVKHLTEIALPRIASVNIYGHRFMGKLAFLSFLSNSARFSAWSAPLCFEQVTNDMP